MNKSFITNLVSFLILSLGYFIPEYKNILVMTGSFALSGAITNWIAVYMLFEKVPFLYGSGVITQNFDSLRIEIKRLIMEEFFSLENIESFFEDPSRMPNKEDIIKNVNFDQVFANLLETIEESSIGAMLQMVGGIEALDPLKEPFIEKLKNIIEKIYTDIKSNKKLEISESLLSQIENIVDNRLEEITPEKVKQIMYNMIHKHLGWLVVWGGLFGGLIGMLISVIENI